MSFLNSLYSFFKASELLLPYTRFCTEPIRFPSPIQDLNPSSTLPPLLPSFSPSGGPSASTQKL